MTQAYLAKQRVRKVTVYHMFDKPRNNRGGFPTCGGFKNDFQKL